jgi:hypothetical protein
MCELDLAKQILSEVIDNPVTVVHRKITTRNLQSPNLVLYRKDFVLFHLGILKTFILVDESGREIERYFGYGLRKLMQSAWPADENYFLAKRFFKPE